MKKNLISILILIFLLIKFVETGLPVDITINAGANAKTIRMNSFYCGYHHNPMYYEQRRAFKRAHDIMKECEHKRPLCKYWRAQNLFTYRNDPNGPDGLRYSTEERSGHCYDTERYTDIGGYNWTKVDEVYDEIVTRSGMNPIVEFNFMPECMAEDPTEVGGWGYSIISPPADYNEWNSLIRNTINHFQNRYGVSETRKWYWGVWNEPDYPEFWKRGISEFYKLYDYSAVTLKNVDTELSIGGPDFAGYELAEDFVQHTRNERNYYTGNIGSPFDYISVHDYKPDVRAACKKVWDLAQYVRNIYSNDYINKKILLTETAPHWSMNMEFFQTRYTATWMLGVIDIFLEAADIYGEFYMPKAILYCGLLRDFGRRSLMVQIGENNDSDEVLKTAPFNVYEILSFLSEERIPVQGCDFPNDFLNIDKNSGTSLDQVRCIATRTPGQSIEIVIYHRDDRDRLVYNQMDDPESPQLHGTYYRETPNMHDVKLTVSNVPFTNAKYKKYVIDQFHSNSYAYRALNNQTNDYNILDKHDDLEQTENKVLTILNGQYTENIEIQQNSVILVILENENPLPGPHLGVTPTTLDFGTNATTMSVSIYNYGDQTLIWNSFETPDQNWITSISPSSGSLEQGKSESATITINRMNLSDGEYEGTVTISSNGGEQSVTILMHVGTPALPSLYRINAGGTFYTDNQNNIWSSDQAYSIGGFGYEGGMISSTQDEILRTDDDFLYQSERYKMDAYRFDVLNGNYQITLHFAEIYFEYPNQRIMNVDIEGETEIINLDIFKDVGHDVAIIYTFSNIPVNDGRIDINFSSNTNNPKISAIEVINMNLVDPAVDKDPPKPPINLQVINP